MIYSFLKFLKHGRTHLKFEVSSKADSETKAFNTENVAKPIVAGSFAKLNQLNKYWGGRLERDGTTLPADNDDGNGLQNVEPLLRMKNRLEKIGLTIESHRKRMSDLLKKYRSINRIDMSNMNRMEFSKRYQEKEHLLLEINHTQSMIDTLEEEFEELSGFLSGKGA